MTVPINGKGTRDENLPKENTTSSNVDSVVTAMVNLSNASTAIFPDWIHTKGLENTILLHSPSPPRWLVKFLNEVYCEVSGLSKVDAYRAAMRRLSEASEKYYLDDDEIESLKEACFDISAHCYKKSSEERGETHESTLKKDRIDVLEDDTGINKIKPFFNKKMSKFERFVRIVLFFVCISATLFSIFNVPYIALILAAAILAMFVFTILYRAFKNKYSILQSEAIMVINMTDLSELAKQEYIQDIKESFSMSSKHRLMCDIKISMKYLFRATFGSVFKHDPPITIIPIEYEGMLPVYINGSQNTVQVVVTLIKNTFGFSVD